MLHNVNHTTYLHFWTLEHIFPCSFHFVFILFLEVYGLPDKLFELNMCVALITTKVQLLISKNQQQIPHGNIQIVQRWKIDTRCTYMHNRSLWAYTLFKKSGGIELVLSTKTSPFNENKCSFASAFHMWIKYLHSQRTGRTAFFFS